MTRVRVSNSDTRSDRGNINVIVVNEDGSLPDLSSDTQITNLDASNATRLISIDALPSRLVRLDLSNCIHLARLPRQWPNGLRHINLTGCQPSLITPEIVALETQECNVIYPRSFSLSDGIDAARNRMEALSLEYMRQLGGDQTVSLTSLFHRFLTEGLGHREGRMGMIIRGQEVTESIKPILDILEPDPQGYESNSDNPLRHMKWMNAIASEFLTGCINQPVRGWSEIAAWMSISETPAWQDKLMAAKQLLTLDKIKEFVMSAAEGIHSESVEVEAGNALLREVHKKMLRHGDIEKEWLGIAGPIAYEGSLAGWLTGDRIDRAYEAVKTDVLARNSDDMLHYVLEGSQQLRWADVMFPDMVTAVNDQFALKQALILQLIESKCLEGNDLLNHVRDHLQIYIDGRAEDQNLQAFYDRMKDKTAEELGEYSSNVMDVEKGQMIAFESKKLTYSELGMRVEEPGLTSNDSYLASHEDERDVSIPESLPSSSATPVAHQNILRRALGAICGQRATVNSEISSENSVENSPRDHLFSRLYRSVLTRHSSNSHAERER